MTGRSRSGVVVLLGALLSACGGTDVHPTSVVGEAVVLERCVAGPDGTVLGSCPTTGLREVVDVIEESLASEAQGADSTSTFAGSGHRVLGRQPLADPYDIDLDRAHIQARAEIWRSSIGPFEQLDELRVGFRVLEVLREGDTAEMSGEFLYVAYLGEDSEGEGVEASLVRGTEGWRLTSLRTWPLFSASVDEREDYDAEHWRARDAEVEAARSALTSAESPEARRTLVGALVAARQLIGARETLVPLIATSNDVRDWRVLRYIELTFGNAEAFAEARAGAEAAESFHESAE